MTEGVKPDRELHLKDIGDLGKMLLDASSLYERDEDKKWEAVKVDYSPAWRNFLKDCVSDPK